MRKLIFVISFLTVLLLVGCSSQNEVLTTTESLSEATTTTESLSEATTGVVDELVTEDLPVQDLQVVVDSKYLDYNNLNISGKSVLVAFEYFNDISLKIVTVDGTVYEGEEAKEIIDSELIYKSVLDIDLNNSKVIGITFTEKSN